MQSIREDLQKTHLEDGDSTEVKMEDVDPEPEASSPRTKRRITEMFQVRPSPLQQKTKS